MNPARSGPVLTLEGLRRSFGALEAVRDLSLEVNGGQVFGLLGPNGAGKTTTIRMICGLLRPHAGQVLVDGRDLFRNSRDLRRRIGLCPQEIIIWEDLTCLEQLVFMGTQYDISSTQARKRSMELLERLGLGEKRNAKGRNLSGGMKRRLNLALALVHDPDLLVLDEPQAGLDPQSRVLVREYILSLARHRTVLLTTHEMDEADRLSHRVGIMDRGRLLTADSPSDLKASHAGGQVLELVAAQGHEGSLSTFSFPLPQGVSRLEGTPGTVRLSGPSLHTLIPDLLREVNAAGIGLGNLTIRPPTLEDVFITLTGRRLRE